MIRGIILRNYKCFRGEQRIKLEEMAYGITARDARNPQRSNFLGKSTVLGAPRFALFGQHDERVDDDWISEGEDEGAVVLELDSLMVERSKRRGRSEQLEVRRAGEKKPLKKAEAQDAIFKATGLDDALFLATAFFQQREMGRYVRMKPSERLDVVRAWFELEKLEKAEEAAALRLSKAKEQELQLRDRAREARMKAARFLWSDEGKLDRTPDVDLDAALRDEVSKGEARLAELAQKGEKVAKLLEAAKSLVQEAQEAQKRASTQEQFDRVVAQGKLLAEQIDEIDEDAVRKELASAQEEHVEAERAHAVARKDHSVRLKLAQGEFDGRCPIADLECPAAKKIRGARKENREAAEKTERALRDADVAVRAKAAAFEKASEEARKLEGLEARIEELRGVARELKEGLKVAPAPKVPLEEAQRLHGEAWEAANLVAQESQALARILRGVAECLDAAAKADAGADEQAKRVELARAAEEIVGARGAQRVVAEGGLRLIDAGANASLAECGIDVRLSSRWERETGAPAKACRACLRVFERSATVKECPRCGEPRGAQHSQKLEIDVSARSRRGAAEDLAGVFYQLSAGAYLRRRRGIAWGTALIDEPFGQLDEHHRRELATHLRALLAGRYGMPQALVISHSPETLNALPGRIEILRDGERTTVRVA